MGKKKIGLMTWDQFDQYYQNLVNQPTYIGGVQHWEKTKKAMDTPESERTQLQKYLLEDLERINQEEELKKAIKKEQEVKNGYEQRKALLEAEDKASSWLGDMGNFFSRISDGYNSIGDMNSYYITKDGKILKKKKFTGILNPTGGVDNKNNTYDESVWEEVKPEDYLKVRNEIAEKRATSDVYDAGYKISDTLDKIIKGLTYDTSTGIMRLIGNIGEGELGKAQANLMLNDAYKWLNNLLLSYYEYGEEKFGKGETWFDRIMWGNIENEALKRLKQKNDELSLNDQNLRNKIKTEFDNRAKSGRERTYYNDLIEDTLGFQDSDDFFTQQQQLRSSVTNLAAQLEGREKPEFLSEEAAGSLNQRMIKLPSLNGGPVQYMPYEKLSADSESLWDAKQMILDENGVPVLDDLGVPAYRNKFTLGDKFRKGNYSDMFTDKYGSEQLIDAGASSASFLLGGAGIGKATSALGKGIGKAGQATSKGLGSLGKLAANNSKFIDGAAKMLNDSRIGKLATSNKVVGVANKVSDKFAYNAKAIANSYLMTNTESQMIGEQTFDNSYNDYIDKAANINSLEIQKELQASGISSSDIDLYLDIELRKRRNEFEQENPEVVKDAIGVASAAKELAVGINNLNTLMNINYGAFFAKTKSFSRTIKKNPLSAKNIVKGGLIIGREGAQEYIEEGVMNQYAQYAGESLAKGKIMSLNDYIENHLSDKESVTSGVIGLFSGAGMSTVMGGINTKSALKQYKKQQKEIQNLKKISDYSKEDLHKFLNGSIDTIELMSSLAEIRKLQDEGKLEESAVAADKMLLARSVRAALTGTSGVLNDTLTSLAQQENLSQEEKDIIQSAIDLNNVIADVNDSHINLAARNKIMENRGLKFLISRERKNALMSSLPDANTRYEEELDRFSRQALNSENESAYLQDNYNDILEEYKRRTQLPADNSANLYLQKTKELINSLQKTEDILDQQYEELKSDKYQANYLNTISEIIANNKIKEVNKDNAEQVKEELRQEEILTPETEAKIDQKVKEQTAKENVGVDPTTPDPVIKPKIQENTETPTQEDELLNNILSQQNEFLGMEDDFDSSKWFSPRQRNTNPATNASAAALAVKKQIESRLGREATFQDFVDRMIQTKGYDYTEEVYNGLRDAVGAIGVDVSQAQEIYNTYFNADENFAQQVESLLAPKTEQEVARENKEVEQKVQQVTAKKEDYDSNNTPQYVDFDESEDRRTATAAPKAAFSRLDVKRISDTIWEVLSRGLTQDSIIDNNFILDSDYIKSGLQLTAQVRDIDEIPMIEYLPNGDFIATTWGQYKAKHKLKPGTKEYADKVPIVVMDGGTPVFMLHEVSWYNTRNISDRYGPEIQESIVQEGKDNLSRIRQQVVSGNNLLQITDTHFGSVDNLEQHVDKTPSTIQDAAGESSTIGVIKVDGNNISIHTTKAGKFAGITMGLDAVDSNGKPMYKDGDTVDIRWAYNNDEGKPVYMVFKTMNNSPIAPQGNLKNNLPENVVNNSKFAILANIVLSNQNNPELRQALEDRYKITLDKAKKIRDQIKEDTNIDIESNLADYIAMYVQVGYSGMNLEQIGNSELRNGLTYFDTKYRNAEGKIKSTPNRLQVMHKTGNTYEGQIEVGGKLTQGRTVQGTISNIEKLFNEESGIFNKAQLSTNLSYLGKKDRIIRDIDSNGNFVQDSKKDYNTFLKSNLRTNVLSHEITTPSGKSKWIIDVQPMVYFDLASEVSSVEELPAEVRQEKIKQDLKETAKEVLGDVATQEVTTSNTEQQKADIERRIQEVENFVNQDFFANSEFLSNHWKTKKDLFENKIKQLKSLLQKGIKTGEDLRTLTNLLNEIRGILNEGININYETPILTNEKNIQELANSLFSLISDDVIKDYIQVMNKAMESRVGSNAVEKMLVEYSDGSGYTMDGKNVEYFLSKETLENAKNNKQINAKYDAELESLNNQTTSQQQSQPSLTFEEATQELTPEQQKELEEFLRRFEDESSNNFNSRWTLTPEQNARLDILGNNNITGLTTEQNEELVSSLKNSVISSIDFTQHVTIGMLREALETSVEKHIQPKLDNKLAIIQAISRVPNMADKVASLQEEADLLQNIINEKEKLINISRDNLGSLTKEFNRIFNVNFEEEQVEDSEEIFDEAYRKSFLEKEIKLSYSVGLRLSLFGIPILNETGNVITNFTGLPRFHSADDVDLKLKDITSSIPSNWNVLISRLQDRFKNRNERIYKQLEEKLTKLPVHLQNELLYKTISKKLDIFKIINSPEIKFIEGEPVVTGYNIRVYDENSTKEDLRLRNSIINDFETSDFAMYDNNKDIILNVKHAEIISKALDKYVKDNLGKNTVDAKKLKEIFNKVGLQAISENTIEEYLNKGNNPFQKKKGILWFVNEKLKQLLEDSKEKKLYLTDKDNNLFSNSRKALNKLVNLEIMLNGSFVAKSIRVNDKIMQGIIANTSLYDILDDLKTLNDSKLYRTLIDNPLTKNNTLLELLQTDERFRESFSVGFSSPDAYKLHGRNNYGKTDFDKLAKQDNLATVLGLYTNTFGYTSLLDPEYKKGLRFRIGQMPVLTLSDKGRMTYLTTALLELKGDDITFNTDGTFNISSAVSKHIAQQVFESELDRIIASYENEHANIINYSKAAKIFLSLPVLNSLTFKGMNIHEYLINSSTRDKLKTGEIREQFINEATVVIQDYLNNKVNEKISPDGSEGQFIDYGIFNNAPKKNTSEASLHNIDTSYVNNKPGEDTLQKLRYTTAEFEINSLLNYNNIHQLFLGDLAFYSKDKTIDNLIGKTIDPTQISKPEVYSKIAKEVGSIVHKRAASLIAPGFKLANSQNSEYGSQEFLHIAINDVEGMSDILKNLIEQQYGELSPEANQVFNQIIEINKQLEVEKDDAKIKALKEKKNILISNNLSEVQDYFNINGTDAQEYTTWKAHIDMLYRQGNLTQQEKALLDSAYEKLSKGEEISPEELQTIMQPVKPVYTGLVPYEGLVRPVYIKSSAFPLLPQVTKNLKIDEVRKKLEALESENNMPVRMSYQSANKIGALNSQLTMDDLYNENLDNIRTKLTTATSVLPFSNFKIQQETPSKEDKAYQKGKDSYITMGSQFFKIILGNGINKMTEDVFPNIFPSEVLDMAGVTNKDMLSGEELDKIYFNVYSQYSKLLMDNLYSELGITSSEDFHNLPIETQNDVIQNLNKILRNEIIERGQPDYLEDSIRLIEEEGLLQTNMPIIFDANRYKFEALMQSIISNRLIVHKLPGNAHISASSEGFAKREISTLEAISEEDRTGIVWLDSRESGKDLQATVNEDGQITASEVIIKSHWKVRDEEGNFKYIDLSSDEYSEPIYEDGKLVGRKLLIDKIDPQLLENFSFRIPTSSHQSGVILKVVGFLPQAAGDLILVPKEHTTQLGEDYDIDKRYIYKSNYYVDSKTGNIKKLVYTDVKEQLDALESMFSEGDFDFDRLVEAVTGSNLEEEFFEALEELRDMGVRSESVDSINKIGKRTLNNLKIKMLENAIIDMYKSVYKSPSTEVQQKIFKPLVTDISGNTANYMEQYVSQDIDNTYFSTLSDSYQRDLLKLGADGKAGIGIHSNAVTFEAQMQRLDETSKIRIQLGVDKNNNPIWFEESIGGLHSDGHLGNRAKTLDGSRDIADQHGENQNVSTDNINKGIMGKRNENTYTMSVYAFMAHLGYDLSKDTVDTGISDNKGNTIKDKVHIPSVFINQPILRDYVRLREKYASITSEFVSAQDIDNLILNELGLIYDFNPGDPTLPITQRMDKEAYETASTEMTGQTLWNNLKDNTWDSNIQQAVIQKFFRFKQQAEALSEIQQLINLSTSRLGVSYFEVLQRISVLNNLPANKLINASKLVGEHYASYMTREHREKYLQYLESIHFEESQKGDEIDMNKIDSLKEETKEIVKVLNESKSETELKNEGYKLVGNYWWKPTTIEGVQLINSLKSAQDVMPINFPYNNSSIDRIISSIFYNKDVDPNKKSVSSLKWKYEIMSALNDFVSTDVGLFNGDATQERKRLFFNSSSNKALARILKDLKEQNNPIMKNSLLRDLEFNIGLPGNVSTISHSTDYSSSFDRLSKYEAFKQLVADDSTSLGEFNGEILTPRKLAQDLATYSYLSNTQNGATGFRNYIAVPYLEAIGVTNNYRDTYKSILSGNFDGQLDNFIKQYFQHNPQRAVILSKHNQESLEFIPIEGDLSKPDGLQKFTLNNSTADFVSVRNPSINYSDNKWNLYQNIDGIYHRIDVLGTTGFNEYNAINPNQKSSLSTQPIKTRATNVGSEYYNKKTNQWIKIPLIDQVLPLDLGVEGILKTMYDSNLTSQEFKRTIERLQDFVNKDIKIEYAVPKSGSFGMYDASTNTITISPDIYEQALIKTQGDFNKAINIVKEVILEEVIHSITVHELKEYIDRTLEDGTVILKDNSPIFATRLVAAFDIARTALPYNPKDISTYYSKDIFEFIAGMYISPEYRDNIEARAPGLIQKFLDATKRLFSHLSNKYKGEELTYKEAVYSTVESLLKTTTEVNTTQEKGIKVNPIEKMKQEDTTQDKPQVESTRVDIGKLSDYTDTTTEVEEEQSTVNNPSQYTNHSGGAYGGDMQGWDAIGREFGVTNHNHYTVAYYDKLTEQEKTELNKQYLETVRFLGRGVISKDTYAGKLVRRDMIQANNGESVYGVTELIKPGVKGRKGYNNKMPYSIPEGGTGYATARGILLNKPTYVFNQSDKYGNEIGWYKWDNNVKDFVKTDIPILSKNFTGIGSQEINELGLQAIRDVYERTFNNQTTESSEDVLKNILDQQDNYLGLNPEDFNSRYNRYPEIKNCK